MLRYGPAPGKAGWRKRSIFSATRPFQARDRTVASNPENRPLAAVSYVPARGRSMADPKPTALPERRRGSGVKMVYDLLRDEILDLKLAPGSPVDEVQLAERFKMSRTPIREALVRLAGEGLIETLPNRSTMVSNIDFLNLSTFFDALVLMYRVT